MYHTQLPVVTLLPNGRIITFCEHPQYTPEIERFLLLIAEAKSRPHRIHEFTYSHETAMSALTTGAITLKRIQLLLITYTQTPTSLTTSIPVEKQLASYSASLQNKLKFLPRFYQEALEELANIVKAGSLRVVLGPSLFASALSSFVTSRGRSLLLRALDHDSIRPLVSLPDGSPLQPGDTLDEVVFADVEHHQLLYRATVQPGKVRRLRHVLLRDCGVCADMAYVFEKDEHTMRVPSLELRGSVKLRPYQMDAIESFCRNGIARSGVIVLPCGAGKTLTGIASAVALGRCVMVLCINALSVEQWRSQFLMFTTLPQSEVTICTGSEKQIPRGVFITTYSMLLSQVNEQADGTLAEGQQIKKSIFETLECTAWGLLILDEVHSAPADKFQRVLDRIRYHSALGLTATLLREDERIDDLRFLVGPKLFEANWQSLIAAGHLARVHCFAVHCRLPASSEDQQEEKELFLSASHGTSAKLLAACIHPEKLWCTQALIARHTRLNPPDKVLVFCESVQGCEYYARALGVPFMDGKTSSEERHVLLQLFRETTRVNCLVMSRVGDSALDLPMANVVIQVSGLGASRRQEAQRLGRVMRPKNSSNSLLSSWSHFYTLVSSSNSTELTEAEARREWIVDQGFTYRCLYGLDIIEPFAKSLQQLYALPSHSALQHPQEVVGDVKHTVLCCLGSPKWQYRKLLSDNNDDGIHQQSEQKHHSVEWCDLPDIFASHVQHLADKVPEKPEDWSFRAVDGTELRVSFDTTDLPWTHGTLQALSLSQQQQMAGIKRKRSGRTRLNSQRNLSQFGLTITANVPGLLEIANDARASGTGKLRLRRGDPFHVCHRTCWVYAQKMFQ